MDLLAAPTAGHEARGAARDRSGLGHERRPCNGSQPWGFTLVVLRRRVLADATWVSLVQERRGQRDEDVVAVVGERPTSACHQQVVQLRTGAGPQHVPGAAGVRAHA